MARHDIDHGLEAERGDTPLLPTERMWGFWEFTYANSALAIATWAFLIGGATALFVGPREGIAAIVIGNILGELLATFSTCVPCGKYGTEQFTFLRSMFGSNGSRLVYVLAVVFLTMGWLAVLGLMFGRSIDGLIQRNRRAESKTASMPCTPAAISPSRSASLHFDGFRPHFIAS